jgi:hypothetical protein
LFLVVIPPRSGGDLLFVIARLDIPANPNTLMVHRTSIDLTTGHRMPNQKTKSKTSAKKSPLKTPAKKAAKKTPAAKVAPPKKNVAPPKAAAPKLQLKSVANLSVILAKLAPIKGTEDPGFSFMGKLPNKRRGLDIIPILPDDGDPGDDDEDPPGTEDPGYSEE